METYPGFTLHCQDGIYIYRVSGITREAVDAWYETDKAQAYHCAATTGHALRLLHITHMIVPTPYFSAKLRQSNQETPKNLYETTAVVIQNPLAFHAIRAFLQRELPNHPKSVSRIFQTEKLAIEWLQQRREHVELLIQSLR